MSVTLDTVRGDVAKAYLDVNADTPDLNLVISDLQTALNDAQTLQGQPPPPPAQTIDSFTASSNSITAGDSATLSWSVSNSTAVRLNGQAVAASVAGFVVTPTADTTYTLEADGSAPTISQSLTIAVAQPAPPPPPPPPQPSNSILGQLVTGAWNAQYAKSTPILQVDITATWNGAAFDYATGTMHVVVAGGHGDSYVNQCFAMKMPDGAWVETSPQTAFPPDQHVAGYAPTYDMAGTQPTAGNGYAADGVTAVTPWVNKAAVYFDGKPASRHVYAGTIWLPTQKQVLLISGCVWHVGAWDYYCGTFDPATGQWTRKGNLPRGYTGIAASYDPVRDRVVWSTNGTAYVYSYDPAADVHKLIGPSPSSPLGADMGAYVTFCCAGDYVWAVRKGGWGTLSGYANAICRLALGQSTIQNWEPVTMSGDVTAPFGINPGFEYDPERNAFVFWAVEDPGNVSILSLDTFAITKVALPSAPSTTNTKSGVWGRFRRYAQNQYCLLYDANQPMLFITLP